MREDCRTINVYSTMENVAIPTFFCTIPALEEALGIESLLGLSRIVRNVAVYYALVFS